MTNPPKRTWFQFRLRSALIALAIASCLMPWGVSEYRRWIAEGNDWDQRRMPESAGTGIAFFVTGQRPRELSCLTSVTPHGTGWLIEYVVPVHSQPMIDPAQKTWRLEITPNYLAK